MSSRKLVRIEPELCIATTGCRECVISCPDRALQVIDGLPRVVRVELCETEPECVEDCAELCPTGALVVWEDSD